MTKTFVQRCHFQNSKPHDKTKHILQTKNSKSIRSTTYRAGKPIPNTSKMDILHTVVSHKSESERPYLINHIQNTVHECHPPKKSDERIRKHIITYVLPDIQHPANKKYHRTPLWQTSTNNLRGATVQTLIQKNWLHVLR